MRLIVLIIVVSSFVAGASGMRSTDPAGEGYALVIPIVFGHLLALVPAFIAARGAARGDLRRRAPLWYVIGSCFGFIPAIVLSSVVPRRGPPPGDARFERVQTPPRPIDEVAAALLGMVNAQRTFARVTVVGTTGRSLLFAGTVSSQSDYERLRARVALFTSRPDDAWAIKRIRLRIGVSDSSPESTPPCAWTPTGALMVECLCGGKPGYADSTHPLAGCDSTGDE